MTISGQEHDIPERASGSPLDDPPELNLEIPEEVAGAPDDPAATAAATPAAPEDEADPAADNTDPETDAAPGETPPALAERDLPGIGGMLAAGAMEGELSAISSLDEVVANELENRMEGHLAGLDEGAEGAAPEAEAEKPDAGGYRGLESDMIDAPGEGLDLMTVLAGLVMGDAAPVDLVTMSDPKKWRYDENPLKQLAERGRPDVTPDQKEDRFRVNARTIVVAGAAVLAMAAGHQARAETAPAQARPDSRDPSARDPGASRTAGAMAAQPAPGQEQAPAPVADDAVRLAARRQEEQALLQMRADEQRRFDAQAAERERQRRLEERMQRESLAASMPAATQARDMFDRLMMMEIVGNMNPDAARPGAPVQDMAVQGMANPGMADRGGIRPDAGVVAPVAAAGTEMAAPGRDGASAFDGFATLGALFRDNVFSVTAPAWSVPDKPGWQTALESVAPAIERDPVQPATPVMAQNGPELFRPG